MKHKSEAIVVITLGLFCIAVWLAALGGPSSKGEPAFPRAGADPKGTASEVQLVETPESGSPASRYTSATDDKQSVTVQAYDELGRPVAGASVVLAREQPATYLRADDPLVLARTDTKGIAVFRYAALPERYNAYVTCDGYLPATLPPLGADLHVSVTLASGYAASVELIDRGGAPLVNVPLIVTASPLDQAAMERAGPENTLPGVSLEKRVQRFQTDSEGRCAITGLSAGDYWLYPPDWLVIYDEDIPVSLFAGKARRLIAEPIYAYAWSFEPREAVVTAAVTSNFAGAASSQTRRQISRSRSRLGGAGGDRFIAGVKRRDEPAMVTMGVLLPSGEVRRFERQAVRFDELGAPEVIVIDGDTLSGERVGCIEVQVSGAERLLGTGALMLRLEARVGTPYALFQNARRLIIPAASGSPTYVPPGEYRVLDPMGIFEPLQHDTVLVTPGSYTRIDAVAGLGSVDVLIEFSTAGAAFLPYVYQAHLFESHGGEQVHRRITDADPPILTRVACGDYTLKCVVPGYEDTSVALQVPAWSEVRESPQKVTVRLERR